MLSMILRQYFRIARSRRTPVAGASGHPAGFLEGINRVAKGIGPDQGLKRSPMHDVIRTIKEFVDVDFHSGVF
jgi:hypothetical protein